MIFRTILHVFLSRFRTPTGHYDVSRMNMRTLPTDLDINRHMNNGVYFSILDVGRFDMLKRNGLWSEIMRRRWYPVVVSETITFRKSLELWQKFTIETRVIGYDEKAVYIEQRIVRPDAQGAPEIYASAFIRGRFLKRSGGTVSVDELLAAFGAPPPEVQVPQWLIEWGADVALPATRAEAPSTWS